MEEEYSYQQGSAPFNMAIATLMSLRNTLDKIRDIEAKIDFPASERQRIKIELVKRFFVDSCPLLNDDKIIKNYKPLLKIRPEKAVFCNKNNQKETIRTIYSYDLNEKLDEYLLRIQVELQKNKYFMPPSEDLGSSVTSM